MEPLTTIELGTCTVMELVTLFVAIEAELWARKKSPAEREVSFVNQEKIRRALAHRRDLSR
jgi:hypothetical protein